MTSRHLLNPLAKLNQPTPSNLDSISVKLESDLRFYGAILIQQAGIMLKAPQVVMATAQVLFQRFWFVTSLKHFSIKEIGLGALFLASKLEEYPLRIRDLINCYSYLTSMIQYCSTSPYPSPASYNSYVPMDYFSTEFYDTKDSIIIAEMQILKRLGFMTQCQLGYGSLINYLKVLELQDNKEVVTRCWGYLNDMLQTPAPALYPPSTLALTSIYLVTRLSNPQISLPLNPKPWWELFDASESELIHISGMLLSLYRDWGNGTSFEQEEVSGGGEGMNIWRKLSSLPGDKKGVREILELNKDKVDKSLTGEKAGIQEEGEEAEEKVEGFGLKGAF